LDLHPKERLWSNLAGKDIQVERYAIAEEIPDDISLEKYKFSHKHQRKLFKWVRHKIGIPYNQMYINCYKNGQQYIGPHADGSNHENRMFKKVAIYSFSYGQERDFVIISKKFVDNVSLKNVKLNISLPNNSLVVMGGEMQKYYTHEVPKRALSTCPGPRINITLRFYFPDN